jgi:predicted  nucleic acid-binding Zn-ribbon protein
LESLRGDLPHQIKRLNQEFMDAQQSLDEQQEKLVVYKKERGIMEMEIRALEGKQQKYQNQLFEVKTNREYDAVTLEIESVKSEISKKESRVLEIMGLEEETQKSISVDTTEAEKLKSQLESRKKELESKLEKTDREETALKKHRIKLLQEIEPRLVSSYERIFHAKNGLAVATVVRNACGGCYKTLPPQRILEVREMDRIYLCEVCGRILVWDEKLSENAA